jgi:hypothetical protein
MASRSSAKEQEKLNHKAQIQQTTHYVSMQSTRVRGVSWCVIISRKES